MKGTSEADVADCFRRLGWVAYKPPDDARTRKPCDLFAWSPGHHVWVEVKQESSNIWHPSELQPSQRQGIYLAQRVGVPYLLVIRWTNRPDSRAQWTCLELTDPQSQSLWQATLPLDGTPWLSRGASALSCLGSIVLRDGWSLAGNSPWETLRPGSSGPDPAPDEGRGIRSVRTGSVTLRGARALGE